MTPDSKVRVNTEPLAQPSPCTQTPEPASTSRISGITSPWLHNTALDPAPREASHQCHTRARSAPLTQRFYDLDVTLRCSGKGLHGLLAAHGWARYHYIDCRSIEERAQVLGVGQPVTIQRPVPVFDHGYLPARARVAY